MAQQRCGRSGASERRAGVVLQLGQLYIYSRIDYNSRFYDEDLLAVFRESSIGWADLSATPLWDDGSEVQELARDLERLRVTWNVWYHDLLVGYRDDVSAAIEAVHSFLEEGGA